MRSDLQLTKRAAASVLRNLPTDIRRVRIWRDQLYRAVGGGGWDEDDTLDATWPSSLQVARGRISGMRMALDLTDWMERRTYFTGRFYQEDIEELLSRMLKPGDNFVDVGANVGLLTLHAAAIVGDNVWAFEPNPSTFARLSRNVAMNGLQCRLQNIGLGSETGTLRLNLYGRHSGRATLVDRGSDARQTVTVDVKRGDEVLSGLYGQTVIKIDVEGFEASVLEGLGNVLGGNVAIVIEVSRLWLEKAGSSAEALHSILERHGLKPYSFTLSESRLKRELSVKPLTGPQTDDQYDCLFMRPDSVFAERLAQAYATH